MPTKNIINERVITNAPPKPKVKRKSKKKSEPKLVDEKFGGKLKISKRK